MNYQKFILIAAFAGILFAVSCAGISLSSENSGGAIEPMPAAHTKEECAASGAIRLGTEMFLVGSDEDNTLRLYSINDLTSVKSSFPLAPIFADSKEATILADPKTDLEGAAWLGDTVLWIGSHSMNSEGTKKKPERRRLFAHTVKFTEQGLTLTRVGQPYANLIEDLSDDARYKIYDLRKAAEIGSKSAGGLSIEAVAAGRNDSLLIGFRNPLTKNRALVATVLNPKEVLQGAGVKPTFGDPVELDLGGLGIRDMAWSKEKNAYFIIAGQFGAENPAFRLYQWSGSAPDAPRQIKTNRLDGLNPEAVIPFPVANSGKIRLLILNDNEKSDVCAKQGFGAIWIDV